MSGDDNGAAPPSDWWVHQPVLLQEVMESLDLGPGLVVADLTVGSAGHLSSVARRIAPGGIALGLDRDKLAVRRAEVRIESEDQVGIKMHLVHSAFDELARVANDLGIPVVDRVLMDLGLSSDQLDDPERGFAFLKDGPLDMRQDKLNPLSAADVVNEYQQGELERIIHDYGEERKAKQIAAEICRRRREGPIERTLELAELIEGIVKRRPGASHPATRTFQALRMEVNDEAGQLARAVPQIVEMLAIGGLLAVITFHSLEERLLKEAMRPWGRHHQEDARARGWMVVQRGRVIVPSQQELRENRRARSAKLRVFEKVGR